MTWITIMQDRTYAGTGVLSATGRIEDCPATLGDVGEESSEAAYEAIERAIAAGESRVELDGHLYTWIIRGEA